MISGEVIFPLQMTFKGQLNFKLYDIVLIVARW